MEGQAVQLLLHEHGAKDDTLKVAEAGWCDSKGTVYEVKAKKQMRQEGAFKRERALAYSFEQKLKSGQSFDLQMNTSVTSSLKSREFDKGSSGWSWLERWMAAKPWENKQMEQVNNCDLEKTPPSKTGVVYIKSSSKTRASEPGSVKERKNNVTARVSAKTPLTGQATRVSSSPST